MNNYVRLMLGQPIEVVLEDPNGVNTTSPKGGPHVKFRLADGRMLYATPFQAGRIRKLNPLAGDRLRLVMRKNSEGKSITEAELLPMPGTGSGTPTRAEPQPNTKPPSPTPISGERVETVPKPAISADSPLTPTAVQPPPAAMPAAPTPIRGERVETMTKLGELLVNGIPFTDADDPGYRPKGANGNGHGANGNSHYPNTPECSLPAKTGHAQFYLERATELIDLVAAAFKYAVTAHNGMFSKDDVRAMVATMYIQHTSKGGH